MSRITPSMQLALELRRLFATAPVKSGLRLRPERELAETLGRSPKCIHRTLVALTAEGILSKRHGSGNYLRKIPVADRPSGLRMEQVFPQSEFETETAPILTQLPEQQRLVLQMWSGYHHHVTGNRNYAVYRKMKSLVEAAGHTLDPRDMVDRQWRTRPVEDIAAELVGHPADAYLVSSPVGELFLEAYRRAFSRPPERVVYLASWTGAVTLEPEISLDGREAVVRAVRRFQAAGLERIAFLGIDEPYHSGQVDRKVYGFAMEMAGLPYRRSLHFLRARTETVGYDADVVADACAALFTEPDGPEAVFVGDEMLHEGVRRALERTGRQPGADLAVITVIQTSGGVPAAPPPPWTAIEFNRDLIGCMAANELLAALGDAGHEPHSMALLGKWRFRGTERCGGDKTVVDAPRVVSLV